MKVSYQNDAEPTRQVVMENLPNYDSSGKNEKETNDDITTNPTEIKGKYPKIVFLIILNEFCERFSYYGIRTVLYIFLSGFLALDKDTATAIYHAFTVICYFSPILGAILADGYIGLYKTILSLSILYLTGETVLTLTSLKPLGAPNVIGPAIGLIIIAFGTGGIKPCVSAFGANQFGPTQKHHLDSFFSVFYASINVGSLIATLLTPVLRTQKCYGEQCYPLAFGIPCVFMAIAIIVFVIGTKKYKRDDERNKKGSIITKTFLCICIAIKNKIMSSKGFKKEHWLDYAETKYSAQMINDVKAFCKVVFVFLPLPVFWALYDQQGSRWTSQAQQLSGRIDSFTILPDQFQAINPILIVLMVPLFDYAIYPLFAKIGLLKKQLSRMAVGLLLCVLAFLLAAVLEWQMQVHYELNNPSKQIKIVNLSPCELSFTNGVDSFKIDKSSFSNNTEFLLDKKFYSNNLANLDVSGTCLNKKGILTFDSNITQTFFLYTNKNELVIKSLEFEYEYKNAPVGKSNLAFAGIGIENFGNLSLNVYRSNELILNIYPIQEIDVNSTKSLYKDIEYDEFTFKINNGTLLENKILTETCGRYTIVIFPKNFDDNAQNLDHVILRDITPNGLSIFWQLIQIIVMSFSEVMYSISGLSFAYSQAPASMKSVLQATWLITVAVGNLIVLIVAESKMENQIWEYVLFAGLLAIATAIFILIAYFYKYVEDLPKADDQEKKN